MILGKQPLCCPLESPLFSLAVRMVASVTEVLSLPFSFASRAIRLFPFSRNPVLVIGSASGMKPSLWYHVYYMPGAVAGIEGIMLNKNRILLQSRGQGPRSISQVNKEVQIRATKHLFLFPTKLSILKTLLTLQSRYVR